MAGVHQLTNPLAKSGSGVHVHLAGSGDEQFHIGTHGHIGFHPLVRCTAVLGGIDQHQYNVVLLNIHKLMITLLGVDAIGGMPTTPAVALSVAGKADDQAAIESRAGGQADTKPVQAEATGWCGARLASRLGRTSGK